MPTYRESAHSVDAIHTNNDRKTNLFAMTVNQIVFKAKMHLWTCVCVCSIENANNANSRTTLTCACQRGANRMHTRIYTHTLSVNYATRWARIPDHHHFTQYTAAAIDAEPYKRYERVFSEIIEVRRQYACDPVCCPLRWQRMQIPHCAIVQSVHQDGILMHGFMIGQ